MEVDGLGASFRERDGTAGRLEPKLEHANRAGPSRDAGERVLAGVVGEHMDRGPIDPDVRARDRNPSAVDHAPGDGPGLRVGAGDEENGENCGGTHYAREVHDGSPPGGVKLTGDAGGLSRRQAGVKGCSGRNRCPPRDGAILAHSRHEGLPQGAPAPRSPCTASSALVAGSPASGISQDGSSRRPCGPVPRATEPRRPCTQFR